MKMFSLILLLLSMIICLPLWSKTTPAGQLAANLEKWQSFRWEGIVQVQSSALSLRKNFVLAKTADALRLDVLDSGVLGLNAQPLVSLYLGGTAILSAPTVEQLQGIDLNWFLPPGTVQSLVHFTDSLMVLQKDILTYKKAQTGKAEYVFDNKYRLSGINSPATGLNATIHYNNNSQPSKITIERAGSQVAELLINERRYKDISIIPLSAAAADSLNLDEMLKGLDLQGINPDSLDLEKLKQQLDPETLKKLKELENFDPEAE
jgi:hypothetical protein